jgi:hypothetical protein
MFVISTRYGPILLPALDGIFAAHRISLTHPVVNLS